MTNHNLTIEIDNLRYAGKIVKFNMPVIKIHFVSFFQFCYKENDTVCHQSEECANTWILKVNLLHEKLIESGSTLMVIIQILS